jgi:hypothetical protein
MATRFSLSIPLPPCGSFSCLIPSPSPPQLLPSTLGPSIELMIEIYFSTNPTAVAHRRESGGDDNEHSLHLLMDFGSDVKRSPTVLQLTLQRGDLCRLVRDKYLLRTAYRIGHTSFESTALAEEVQIVEASWHQIAELLLDHCRWRRSLQGMSVLGKGYYAKLTQAMGLLSLEFVDTTSLSLDSKPTKMITEKAVMKHQSSKLISASSRGAQRLLSQQSSGGGEESDLSPSRAELVLVLSTVLHQQTCQVMSLSERRPMVSLQVMVWQKGIQFGVVAFDRTLRDIYLVQPTVMEQETICIPLQAAGSEEVAINLSLYITGLTYQEEVRSPHLSSHSHFLATATQ